MALLPTDPNQQKKLLLALLPLVLAFLYYQFVHGPRTEQIEELEARLEQLERANAAARVLAERGGPELQRRLAVYEQHMTRLEELLPRREEVAELLHSMTLRAQSAGVELTGLRPESEEPSPYYTRHTYEVNVRGAYHNVGRFLTEVGSLPRIITPAEFKLTGNTGMTDRTGSPLLNANFRIITYIVPEPTPSAETPTNHAS
jgi:type IV pilus assembly protein PilO